MDNNILLAIKNGAEEVTNGVLGGMLRACGYALAVILVVIAGYSLYGEIKAIILHEKPTEIDGVKPLSTKATFIADAAMLTTAAVIFFVII